MRQLFPLLFLFFMISFTAPAQENNFQVTGIQALSYTSTPAEDHRYDVTLNSKIIRNAAFRGTLLQLSSYGAFMWLTNENVWLSYGLSVLTVAGYSLVDDPNNWNAHLGHIGAAAVMGVSISIPLNLKKQNLPYRILNY